MLPKIIIIMITIIIAISVFFFIIFYLKVLYPGIRIENNPVLNKNQGMFECLVHTYILHHQETPEKTLYRLITLTLNSAHLSHH